MTRPMGPVQMRLLAFCVLMISPVEGAAPVIQTFNKVGTLNENSLVNVQLSEIFCDDADGDAVSVTIQLVTPITPCTNCFEVLDCAPNYCLQYRAGIGSLNYNSAQSYLVRVICEDGTDTSASEIIQVVIIPNTAPYWDPDVLYVDNPINAAGTAAGDLIYDANALDDDGDTVTYSMQVLPSSAAFGFTIDSATGEITSAVDLRAVCEPHVTFLVTASDGQDESSNLVINSPMTDANVAPVAMNLDREVEVPEDATGTVYTLEFIDGDDLSYVYDTTNTQGFAQFDFIARRRNLPPNVDTVVALDYEDSSLRETFFTVQASDGFCTSPLYWVRLVITDVNEEPVLSPTRSTISVCEGEVEYDLGLTLTDEDTTDSHTWAFNDRVNRNAFHDINPTSGLVRTTFDYDLDENNNPERQIHIVEASDKGGLVSTATVTTFYVDCNDNAPFFDGTQFRHRTTLTATECTVGGSVLGQARARDVDSDREGNNVITYSGGAGCCRADAGGRIIVDSALPAGNVVIFDVFATDSGQTPGPLTSEVALRVTVVFTVCPTPVTTTTAAPVTTTTTTAAPTTTTEAIDFTESHDNLPWIIVAALLALVFLALLTYMLWRYWPLCVRRCTCRCKRRKRKPRPKKPMKYERTPTPIRNEPKPEKPAYPGFLYGFWKTRYPNDDAKTVPNLKTKPEPGDMEVKYQHTIDPVEQPHNNYPPPQEKSKFAVFKKCCNIL